MACLLTIYLCVGPIVKEDHSKGRRQEATRERFIRSRHRLAAYHRASRSLAEATTVAEAMPQILEALCAGLGWAVGELWVPEPAGRNLRCSASWHRPGDRLDEVAATRREMVISPASPLVGRAFASAQPIWIA